MNKPFAYSKNGTPIFIIEDCHPHFTNKVAVEAIKSMVIPAVPADPTDRNQTRICETYDAGRIIGVNHRVKKEKGDTTFYLDRGIKEPRGYKSHMVLKPCAPTTKITSVIMWYENQWLLYTNHEGEPDPYCEPGTERFKALDEKTQKKAEKWYYNHPLSPTPAELEKAIKEYEEETDEEEEWLWSWEGAMTSLEWNGRYDAARKTIRQMKEFREYAR